MITREYDARPSYYKTTRTPHREIDIRLVRPDLKTYTTRLPVNSSFKNDFIITISEFLKTTRTTGVFARNKIAPTLTITRFDPLVRPQRVLVVRMDAL